LLQFPLTQLQFLLTLSPFPLTQLLASGQPIAKWLWFYREAGHCQ